MHAYRKMHDIIQKTGEFYSSTSIRFHELRKYNQFFITINAERYFIKGNTLIKVRIVNFYQTMKRSNKYRSQTDN